MCQFGQAHGQEQSVNVAAKTARKRSFGLALSVGSEAQLFGFGVGRLGVARLYRVPH